MSNAVSNYFNKVTRGEQFPVGGDMAKWQKVKELKVGAEILVAEYGHKGSTKDDTFWDEIVSIEKVGREQVYDIEVEGTHNFIGNGIVAHNTYINGNVGIGTTNPQRNLHVYRGTDGAPVRFEDSNGYCEIDPTSTTWTCTSDIRLKKDVEKISAEDALARINQLDAVTFRWNKQDSSDPKNFGLVAQDVEKIFPEFVTTNEQGLKSVAYGSFTPVILSAIKAQSVSMKSLQEVSNYIELQNNPPGSVAGQFIKFLTGIETEVIKANRITVSTITDLDGVSYAKMTDVSALNTVIEALAQRVNSLEASSSAAFGRLASIEARLDSQQGSSNPLDLTNLRSLILDETLQVLGESDFRSPAYFKSITSFLQDVVFTGRPIYESEDMAGYAVIYTGEKSIRVTFDKPYNYTPVINLTPKDFVGSTYKVVDEDEMGFVIELSSVAIADTNFAWSATPVTTTRTRGERVVTPTPQAPSPTVEPPSPTPTVTLVSP